MKKIPYNVPSNLNLKNINKMTLSSGSDIEMSIKSGDSNIKNKKNNGKATVIGIKNKKI